MDKNPQHARFCILQPLSARYCRRTSNYKFIQQKHPNEQIDVVCKACHGKIDTMNVVQMANDFTMGWCIECHRTTEVDMGNTYNRLTLKSFTTS